jgi:hypothetical protein
METKTIYNSDLHFEHQQWNKELAFWKDELKSFQNRLDELVIRWTDHEVLAKLDQFQNHFNIHKNKIDEFKENIHAHELNISKHFEANKNAIDRVHFKQHSKFREQIETQRDIYNDLKKRFFKFLSKYM